MEGPDLFVCICQLLKALLQAADLCLRNHEGTLRLPDLPVPLFCCDLHTGSISFQLHIIFSCSQAHLGGEVSLSLLNCNHDHARGCD